MSEEVIKKSFEISLKDVVPAQEIQELAQAAADLSLIAKVSDDSSARKAKTAMKSVQDVVKLISDRRMALTRKVDDWKKSIIEQERDITAAANKEITRVKGLISEYLTAKAEAEAAARAAAEAARLEEQRKAEEAAAAEAILTGKDVVAPVVEPQVTETAAAPLVRGVTAKTIWTFSVTDPDAVPRAYCSPDDKLIRAYMDAVKKSGGSVESLSVPGVEFRKEIRV